MSAINLFALPEEGDDEDTPATRLEVDLSDSRIFREMADNALPGIMLHQRQKPLYVNRSWAALHGMSVDEVMALPTIRLLIHESDLERLKDYANKRTDGDDTLPTRYRYRALHKSGRSIWLEQFVRVIDWQGVRTIQSTVIDVDDQERQNHALRRKQLSMKEEALQRSQALSQSNRELYIHQSTLDQLSERISVVGRDYRFRMANRANLEFRDLTREQIIGLDLRETFDEAYFKEDAKSKLDRAFEGHTDRFEKSVTAKGGAQSHIQVTTEPFRDPDGVISGAIVSVRDITLAKETEEQLRLFESVIEQISDRISVVGLDYRLRLTNKANLDFHNQSNAEMIGHHLSVFVGQEYFEKFSKPYLDRCFKGETVRFRRPHIDKDGTSGTLDILLEPYREADGKITGAVARLRDVTEAQAMSERLAYQARYDQLTGLPNRQTFEQLLEQSIKDAGAGGRTDALCFIDLDQFKVVNDTVGHLIGDELLKQVAKLLSEKLHEGDVLARFGGDEFALLLRNCSLRRASRAAEQLITALQDFKFFHEGLMFRVGASVGVTAINRHATDAGDLLTQADLACYAAKDNGRNQVQIFKKSDVAIRNRQDEMYRAGGIRTALDDDRLVLYGQPILPTSNDRKAPHHFEILLRMKEKGGRVIEPSKFIPVAERYGFMNEVDRWVIRETVSEMATSDGALAKATVSINLSGITLNDRTSLDFIRQTLGQSAVDPSRITFEITETAAVRNMTKTRAFIDELRDWGCKFALDDFGSGLSSLKYLKRLPVDYLKIDGSFICDLAKDDGSRAMVKAINQMAEDLGIQTVAEGVENLSTLDTLKKLGIDYVQGYAIGLPRPLSSNA